MVYGEYTSQDALIMNFGEVVCHLPEILNERGISKNRLCKDLDIPRTNFNRYCRGEFQRIDVGFICKICWYLEIDLNQLFEYKRPDQELQPWMPQPPETTE